MKEFQVQSIHFNQLEVQKIISLMDFYIDIAIENKPDETEVENLYTTLMDICKDIYQRKYEEV